MIRGQWLCLCRIRAAEECFLHEFESIMAVKHFFPGSLSTRGGSKSGGSSKVECAPARRKIERGRDETRKKIDAHLIAAIESGQSTALTSRDFAEIRKAGIHLARRLRQR
jgi:hypothetical protein